MTSLAAQVCPLILASRPLDGRGRVTDGCRGDTDGGRMQLDVERMDDVSTSSD